MNELYIYPQTSRDGLNNQPSHGAINAMDHCRGSVMHSKTRFLCLIAFAAAGFWSAQSSAATYVDIDAVGAANGTSWADAFPNLQDALDCVASGACPDTELWVAAGEYFPDVGAAVTADDPLASFHLVEGIQLYGGFDGIGPGGVGGAQETLLDARDYDTNKTILSGDLLQDDTDPNADGVITKAAHINGANSQHVVTIDASVSAITDATVLDGFYVTAGVGGAVGGGGLLCSGSPTSSCDPLLSHLKFRGNKAVSGFGGAIFASYSNATLTDVAIAGSKATFSGGGLHGYAANLTLTDCTFTENKAESGGAISFYESEPTVTATLIQRNSATSHGGGIYASDSSPHLTGVTFLDNSADAWGGGMFHWNGQPSFLNTGFFGNSASDGGAVYTEINSTDTHAISYKNPVFSGNTATASGGALSAVIVGGLPTVDIDVINGTFNRNSAGNAGGSFYDEGPTIDIVNSIFWGSTDGIGFNEIHVESGTVNMSFSDLQGLGGTGATVGPTGTFNDNGNNLSFLPLFVDFDGADAIVGTLDDDLHLTPFSVCIDAGDNAAVKGIFSDYDGGPRINGGVLGTVDMGAYER